MSPGRLQAIVAAVPSLGIGVNVVVSPQNLARLVPLVANPRMNGWQAFQEASAFGARMSIAGGHSGLSQTSLDFTGEPGSWRAERGRVEQWLDALMRAGLLPPQAVPGQLAESFFSELSAALEHEEPAAVEILRTLLTVAD